MTCNLIDSTHRSHPICVIYVKYFQMCDFCEMYVAYIQMCGFMQMCALTQMCDVWDVWLARRVFRMCDFCVTYGTYILMWGLIWICGLIQMCGECECVTSVTCVADVRLLCDLCDVNSDVCLNLDVWIHSDVWLLCALCQVHSDVLLLHDLSNIYTSWHDSHVSSCTTVCLRGTCVTYIQMCH